MTISLFRPAGTAPDDLKTLIVTLKTQITRRDFGASSYGDLVGDIVTIGIDAQINAAA